MMKYTDRNQKRRIAEIMAGLLSLMKPYLNDDARDAVEFTIRLLRETETMEDSTVTSASEAQNVKPDCDICKHYDNSWNTEICDSCTCGVEKPTNWEAQGTHGDCISRRAAIESINAQRVETDGIHIWRAYRNESCDEFIDILKTLPSIETDWIPVNDKLPEPLETVIITWENHEPEPYYWDIKDKPMVGVGIYHGEKWWWWSAYAEDMLAEYGDSKADRMDKAIEVTAWIPLPGPFKAERREDAKN